MATKNKKQPYQEKTLKRMYRVTYEDAKNNIRSSLVMACSFSEVEDWVSHRSLLFTTKSIELVETGVWV